MFVTPGVIVDGQLVTNDLVDINLNIRILLGSSYYDDWQNAETFVKKDPLEIRWTKTIHGTKRQFPAPEARFQRQLYLGHVAALV